jgi:hypothetical protein
MRKYIMTKIRRMGANWRNMLGPASATPDCA